METSTTEARAYDSAGRPVATYRWTSGRASQGGQSAVAMVDRLMREGRSVGLSESSLRYYAALDAMVIGRGRYGETLQVGSYEVERTH